MFEALHFSAMFTRTVSEKDDYGQGVSAQFEKITSGHDDWVYRNVLVIYNHLHNITGGTLSRCVRYTRKLWYFNIIPLRTG